MPRNIQRFKHISRDINEIIVHCTATPRGMEVTRDMVDAWHKEKKWDGIGYHYLVRLDGTVEEGRPLYKAGAHCYDHNVNSIGVAYAGGLDEHGNPCDTRTPEQKVALRAILVTLKTCFPQARIYGHRDFASKACPCFDATKEYADV